MKYKVTEQENGTRLDQFLAKRTTLTRSQLTKFIRMGKVICNRDEVTKAGFKVKTGDSVYFREPKWFQAKDLIKVEHRELKIVYEDKYFLVVDKPPAMVVHPAVGNREGTLLNAVLGYLEEQEKKQGIYLRPILVHRLDKDTSGLILVAKHDEAYAPLAALFEKRRIQKSYLALVQGHIQPPSGTIEAPLKRHVTQRLKMAVSGEDSAKAAVTHYLVKEYFAQYTLLELKIETGRTHQIRVHLSAIGYPVAGDVTYGNQKDNAKLQALGLSRQFLHAARLEFVHPWDKKKVKLESKLPEDLEQVLGQLK